VRAGDSQTAGIDRAIKHRGKGQGGITEPDVDFPPAVKRTVDCLSKYQKRIAEKDVELSQYEGTALNRTVKYCLEDQGRRVEADIIRR
jgi:hypothetical protein